MSKKPYSKQETGRQGEAFAAQFLRASGYTIIKTNARFGRLEVDILASKEKCLHLIEVKTRSDISYGYPEDAVDEAKINRLVEAAERYLVEHVEYSAYTIDIISLIRSESGFDLEMFEDVQIY